LFIVVVAVVIASAEKRSQMIKTVVSLFSAVGGE
jgi:hypothetical protein